MQGGQYFKSGHIGVEFAPSFEDQVLVKVGFIYCTYIYVQSWARLISAASPRHLERVVNNYQPFRSPLLPRPF